MSEKKEYHVHYPVLHDRPTAYVKGDTIKLTAEEAEPLLRSKSIVPGPDVPTAEDTAGETPDLSTMTKDQLVQFATSRGLTVDARSNKADLLVAITEAIEKAHAQ